MKVTAIDARVVMAPLRRAQFKHGRPMIGGQPLLVVRVQGEDGRWGFGEVSSWPVFVGGTAEGFRHVVQDVLAAEVLGQDLFDARGRQARLRAAIPHATLARAAVDAACWDLAGRHWQQPVHRLFSSAPGRFTLSYSISAPEPDEVAREATSMVKAGYRCFKLKFGGRPWQSDLERLAALRDAVGTATVRVDCNGSASPGSLRRIAPELVRQSVDLLEQPLPAGSWDALRNLRRWLPLPLALDEDIDSVDSIQRAGRESLCDVVVLKLGRCGSLLALRHWADVAADHGLEVYAGALNESMLGMAASAHAFSGLPGLVEGCDFYFAQEILADLGLRGGLLVTDGTAGVTDGPGLGTEVPEEWFA